jgi:hypothetical protein
MIPAIKKKQGTKKVFTIDSNIKDLGAHYPKKKTSGHSMSDKLNTSIPSTLS